MVKTKSHMSIAGFTLMETMVIVVIIGVMAGLTIPAFSRHLQRQKVQGARNELIADIQYARSLAIARRTTYRMDFEAGQYQIVLPGPETVMRTKTAPEGVIYNADVNPRFYAWGLVDATNITIAGGCSSSNLTLAPNGAVTHD